MYNSNDVATKIKAKAKDNKITVKQVLIDSGLSDNLMTGMRNSMPKADNLAKIADVLDCSVDYLLGRTDNPKSHSSVLSEQTDIDPQAEEFLRKFIRLSKENRDTILTLIDKLS